MLCRQPVAVRQPKMLRSAARLCAPLRHVPQAYSMLPYSLRTVRTAAASTDASETSGDVSAAMSAATAEAVAEATAEAVAEAPYAPAPEPEPLKPGQLDAQRFKQHYTVDYWQSFGTRMSFVMGNYKTEQDASSVLAKAAKVVQDLLATNPLQDATGAAYWSYHLGRTGFFATQGAASLVAHHLYETFGAGASSSTRPASSGTPLSRMSANAANELLARVVEAIGMYQQDLISIRDGTYQLPWDMTTVSHRQYNPLFVLSRSALYLNEAVQTLSRRVRNQPEPVWLSSSLYPDYFQKTFHYQTDGWFSQRSATVYEFSTEVLFFGRQDAMQRTSLLPVAEYMQGKEAADMRLLEVAAGTGRFHTFIKDNWPAMSTVCSDLSPFYLAKARDNMKYWKQQRQAGKDLGGTDGTGTTFLQTAAEKIDAPDASFDIVTCIYLFHEIPEPVRRAAAAEMFRVLKPGGLCVITDSAQLGDRPEWDASIGMFSEFNEPHYRGYVGEDLGGLFQEAGFVCGTKYQASASKTLSFMKPSEEEAQAARQELELAQAAGLN